MSGSRRAPSKRHRRAAPPAPAAGTGRGRRRRAPKRRTGKLMGSTAMLLAAAASWFTLGAGKSAPSVTTAGAPDLTPIEAALPGAAHTDPPAADRSTRAPAALGAIPGLGPAFAAKIPATTNQVLLASGNGKDSSDSTVTLWTRTGTGWSAGASWPAHNAYKGWTDDHTSGDLRSPIGVFALTDAGGRSADPGSKLPYDRNDDFVMGGTGFNGEPLAGSFDYVVAINYNRVAGTSPLDTRQPEGAAKGGGIWLHVDHGGPTHGCVSLTEDHMAELIRTLDPAAHPVIVMGDATSLAA
ncbi:L,D-transpeptidase family protein [Kitasatospora sp. NPDC002227]|uniref:L,D-transpeptidase family protein n=1 Tax=Kitasatospora sp. NPDC002227 TaxID=3154773 RepID=UPI00332BD054